jgi:5'-methylthioadenosine phosphorylase
VSDPVRLGVIGGSGLYDLPNFVREDVIFPETPYGSPSGEIVIGSLAGNRIAFLARHGAGHRLSPSEVPYAANIYALKALGVERLLSVSAVGSLREEVEPRSFCIPDNLIDRTTGRQRTFFGDGITAHVSMADPFCLAFSDSVALAATKSTDLAVSNGGTYVCIEGPQFSTRSESELFRQWGASIIGMTALPEARLAREAELCYACLAMVTDYDVWHSTDDVSVEIVIENLMAMAADVAGIVSRLVANDVHQCDAGCGIALDNAIITAPDVVDADVWERLGSITSRYLREHSQQ